MQSRDLECVLCGSPVPFLLRRTGIVGQSEVVADRFIHTGIGRQSVFSGDGPVLVVDPFQKYSPSLSGETE